MGKIFDIYLAKKDQSESSVHALLSFPATLYQMQDAFDKLRLAEGEALYWEVTEYHQFEELSAVLNDSCGLYELNALVQKLSELDATQCTAFSGLLTMEQKIKQPIPITRLIDLAYSTDCCHVAGRALNDSQLGRIRAESGHVSGIDKLPKDVFEMLDFERIGRNIRISENGMFVERSMDHPGGYVAQHSPVVEAAGCQDLLSAGLWSGQMHKYTFSPQISFPAELAKGELSVLLCKPDTEALLPYVKLVEYGRYLLKKRSGDLTSYGLIERTDGQPIHAPWQEQPEGGMTLG